MAKEKSIVTKYVLEGAELDAERERISKELERRNPNYFGISFEEKKVDDPGLELPGIVQEKIS